MDDNGSPDQEVAVEQLCDDNCYSDHANEETLDLDDLAPDDIRLFEEFRKLLQFFYELPKDMFRTKNARIIVQWIWFRARTLHILWPSKTNVWGFPVQWGRRAEVAYVHQEW